MLIVVLSLTGTIALLLILFMVVIPLAIGLAGGWAALAKEYRLRGRFDGPRWWFQDITLRGWCNYSGCNSVGANADGLYLNTVLWLLHPPLYIPWSELSVARREVKFLGLRTGMIEFETQRVPGVHIALREAVVQKIAAARTAGAADCTADAPLSQVSPEASE